MNWLTRYILRFIIKNEVKDKSGIINIFSEVAYYTHNIYYEDNIPTQNEFLKELLQESVIKARIRSDLELLSKFSLRNGGERR